MRRREGATRGTTSRQTRWYRRRVRATGHRASQGAFHRLVPDLAIRAGEVAFAVRLRGALHRTRSLASSPARPVKSEWVASSYPACLDPRRVSPDRAAPAGKMRLTDFCNQLTSRAPARCPIPEYHRVRRLGFRLLDTTPGEPSGGAPLDGGPPASALLKPAFDSARTEVPTPPPLQAIAILWDPRSRDPSRCATRPRPCRPHVELPARPLTPSVAPAPIAPGLSVGFAWERPPGTAFAAAPSRVTTSAAPGRLPSTSALSSAVVRDGSHHV